MEKQIEILKIIGIILYPLGYVIGFFAARYIYKAKKTNKQVEFTIKGTHLNGVLRRGAPGDYRTS